jgi:hypothetical protein
MLHLHRHVVVDDRHLDVADHPLVHRRYLVYLIYKEKLMQVLRQYVVENLHQLMDHRCVVHLDVLQILDEQNLDVIPPFLDEMHLDHLDLQVVVADAELRHLLKMDCFLDEVDAELRPLLKMDCYLDEVQELKELEHFLLRDRQPHALQLLLC